MKTFGYGALRALLLLVVIASLTACVTASTYTAIATHAQSQIDSPMPAEPIAGEDKNLKVTARVMQKGEPNFFAKTGACYQLDVQVQNLSSNVIELIGNDASVGGKKVTATCDGMLLFDIPTGVVGAMADFVTGGNTNDIERAKVMEQTVVAKRVLRGPSSTQAYDYLPRDRIYEGFYFSYKIGTEEYGFPISFSPTSVSVATTAPAP